VKNTILTYTGHYFDFNAPEQSRISIIDIAHALSQICRFTGHCWPFYSVAEHSVRVSYLTPPEHALAGLLHDAAEAYIGDVAKPLKIMLPDYAAIERRVETAVLKQFGLPAELPMCVKIADNSMLKAERRDLMARTQDDTEWAWLDAYIAPEEHIVPMSAAVAESAFLLRYQSLTGVL